jgi:Cu-processing system permease protein
MRVRETGLIAVRELRESMRSRWFALAASGFFALSLGLAWLGLAGAERSGVTGFDRTTASLLNLVLLFVPLLTLALGGLGIAGEVEDGSLGFLLSQPVTRAEVYAGKYLGSLVAVSAAISVGFGATGVVVGIAAGGGEVKLFLALVGLTLLLAAATLAIGTVLSAALLVRARVIGAAFSSWLVLVFLSDLGIIGLTIARDLPAEKVLALALLNPIEDARILGTLLLSDRPEVLGPAGLAAIDFLGHSGAIALAASAIAFVGFIALHGGYRFFIRAVVP